MGFVQAGFLVTLAAIAIPVIIHLMFARPRAPRGLGDAAVPAGRAHPGGGTKTGETMAAAALRTSALVSGSPCCLPAPS